MPLSEKIITALDDLKAENIIKLDVKKLTYVTDVMIIASGNSNRHLKALAKRVEEVTRDNQNPILGIEGEDAAEWILCDLGDIIVHLMLPETREFYALEKLWSITDPKQRSS